MARVTRLIGLAAVVFIGLGGQAAAQDTNYWTLQYGTRSELIGGIVVGSHLDLSSTFYNPGAVAILEGEEILLSAKAFEHTSITADNARLREPISDDKWDTAPTLFTAQLPSKWMEGVLAFSILTRQEFDFDLQLIQSETGDLIPGEPGDEKLVGEFVFGNKLNEYWGGLTWSREVANQTGVGVTLYGIYRSQNRRSQVIAQALAASGEGASSIVINQFNYSHYRTLVKFGLAWDKAPVKFGFNVTSPSLALFGGGKAQVNRSLLGVDSDGDTNKDGFLFNTYQDDLSATYKSSWAVAAGFSYDFGNQYGKTAIHVGAEWFSSVDRFVIMETQPVPVDTFGLRIFHLDTELGSVLNWGVGVEHFFSKKLSIYGAFTTDKSAAVPGSDTNATISTWDLWHITTGAAFQIVGLDLTLGLAYASGGNDVEREEDSGPPPVNPIALSIPQFSVDTQRVKIIVGFAFSI
jgi:hypothetical protein